MPRKKAIKEPITPLVQQEKELALEEKEVQLEERKLAVWKLKFEFWKSAGRDVLILVTGLAGTVGGGAIKAFLDYSEKVAAIGTSSPPPPPPKPGDTSDLMPPPSGGSSYPTLTPPDVLFGKGHSGGQVQYQMSSESPMPPRNETVYLAGHALWGLFILLMVWGVWRRLRKVKVDGAPVEPEKPGSL